MRVRYGNYCSPINVLIYSTFSMKIYSFWINDIEHGSQREHFVLKNVGSSNLT